jgi:hypothetical protein
MTVSINVQEVIPLGSAAAPTFKLSTETGGMNIPVMEATFAGGVQALQATIPTGLVLHWTSSTHLVGNLVGLFGLTLSFTLEYSSIDVTGELHIYNVMCYASLSSLFISPHE